MQSPRDAAQCEMCEHPAAALPLTLSLSPSPSFSPCPCLVRYMSEMSCVSVSMSALPPVCHVPCATALQISHLLPVTKYDTKINIID